MNALPLDWSQQLEAAFPRRSGPSGWRGMKLMLALRRALFDSTWEQIIDGCKNYKAYCQAAGKEGTEYVQAPQRFIEDQSYLESFAYKVPEDPKVVEHRKKEADRLNRAVDAGRLIGLSPLPGECAAAFETRIRLEKDRPSRSSRDLLDGSPGSGGEGGGTVRKSDPQLSSRIASLSERMRISK